MAQLARQTGAPPLSFGVHRSTMAWTVYHRLGRTSKQRRVSLDDEI